MKDIERLQAERDRLDQETIARLDAIAEDMESGALTLEEGKSQADAVVAAMWEEMQPLREQQADARRVAMTRSRRSAWTAVLLVLAVVIVEACRQFFGRAS